MVELGVEATCRQCRGSLLDGQHLHDKNKLILKTCSCSGRNAHPAIAVVESGGMRGVVERLLLGVRKLILLFILLLLLLLLL